MRLNTTVLMLVVGVLGCSSGDAPGGARFTIATAPLELANVDDACYGLTVFAGATASAPVVWSEDHICADRYGDGRGSLSYVGTCDASVQGQSLVRLVVEDLCSGGPCAATTPGATSLPLAEWRNPCAAPEGCELLATCRENADTPVTFDLVIARSAKQGFFDIAVEFEDIFCSGKLDCRDDDGPITLLHDPATGERGPTVVVAWACTAGVGSDTWLYYDNLVIRCYEPDGDLIGAWPYDPSTGPGNAGPGSAPFVFQTGVYRTQTGGTGVASWNMAFGIRPEDLPGRCVLSASATASDGPLTDHATAAGTVYPVIGWEVELSAGEGALSCTQHPLDGGNGVATGYTSGPSRAFSHAMHASDATTDSAGRVACDNSPGAAFTQSPQGVTVRVGDDQSAFYALPAGLKVEGCCNDSCCE